MKNPLRTVGVLALAASLSGCYHASVVTSDMKPSAVVLDKQWAPSFVLGLVPPPEIDATEKCTDGVARVETELTFLNQVVGLLTFGIYTPMRVKVTCGDAGSMSYAPSRYNGDIDTDAVTPSQLE